MEQKTSARLPYFAMTSILVDKARSWADFLVLREARGPGDFMPAMSRVARRIGVRESFLKTLRYKSPKDVPASIYESLRAAYEAECLRQEQKLEHELRIARALADATGSAFVRAAVAGAAGVAGVDFPPADDAPGV